MAFLETKEEKKSFTITVVIHVVLLLLLFLFGLKYMDPPLENGIAVNFGTTDMGSGDTQPETPVKTTPETTPTQEQAEPEPEVEEEVVTQETEEAPVIEKEEEEPKETEETPEEEPEEEPKKEPTPDRSTSDAVSSIVNAEENDGESETSEGDDNQSGDKGDPDGDPNSSDYYGIGKGLDGDGNYLLGGRKAINKKIIEQDCNEEGVVVVDIDVDRNGNVTKAVPGVKGTTNNSSCLLEPAKRAALETKFNSDEKAPARQVGKIIYRFSLSE